MIRSALRTGREIETATFTNVGTVTFAAGSLQNITQGIIQGIGSSQREGNQIQLTMLHARVHTFSVAVSGVSRYILFQDTQANGVVPTVVEVLDNANMVSVRNGLNWDTNKRFHMLADFTHQVPIAGEAIKVFDVTFSAKLLKPVTYLATTSVAAANGKNAIYMLVIGNSTNTYDYSFQVVYTDS